MNNYYENDKEIRINGEAFSSQKDIFLYDPEEAGKTHSTVKINGNMMSKEEFKEGKGKQYNKSTKFRSQMAVLVDMKDKKKVIFKEY